MPDREKVIKGLEIQLDDLQKYADATELLTLTQEHAKEILALLKEQEAVKPVEEFIKGINCHYYHCKRCGNIVGTILDDKHPIFPGAKVSIKHFCDVCGQAVKWNA